MNKNHKVALAVKKILAENYYQNGSTGREAIDAMLGDYYAGGFTEEQLSLLETDLENLLLAIGLAITDLIERGKFNTPANFNA